MKQDAVATVEPQSLAIPTPMRLIEMAMTQGLDADKLGQLMDLQMRWEANEARKAYMEALHDFRQNAPIILKNKKVEFKEVKYRHAELDKICEVLIPELGKYNLSAGWRPEPAENGKIRMSCVLMHRQGHSAVEATIEGPPDTTGSKNAIQAIGSTHSYLERYTLLAALGIVPKNMDNDGRTGEAMPEQSVEDFCENIRQAQTKPELKVRYEEAKAAANRLSDSEAVKRFVAVADKRQKEINGAR